MTETSIVTIRCAWQLQSKPTVPLASSHKGFVLYVLTIATWHPSPTSSCVLSQVLVSHGLPVVPQEIGEIPGLSLSRLLIVVFSAVKAEGTGIAKQP
jgi:hypothetical protein